MSELNPSWRPVAKARRPWALAHEIDCKEPQEPSLYEDRWVGYLVACAAGFYSERTGLTDNTRWATLYLAERDAFQVALALARNQTNVEVLEVRIEINETHRYCFRKT